MALGPVIVTGVSGVPASAHAAIVVEAQQVDPYAALTALPPDRGGAIVPIDSLRGTAFLDRLTELSRTDAVSALTRNPDTVAQLLERPPAASVVANWWGSAPASTRSAMLLAAPEAVGNLEGVPTAARDIANRAVLRNTAAAIDERLRNPVGRAERTALLAQQHMLGEVERALRSDDGVPRRLVAFDPEGEGRAVVAVGDPSNADYVTYLVPGMFFGVDAQIVAWTETAADLAEAQREWLERLHPDAGATVATIAWIGYTTPSLLNVASMELAREGRDALASALRGLQTERADDQPHLSIVAHSYGSTAALLCLEEEDVWVDSLALVGSPGSTARSTDVLHVRGGDVWVGAAEWDPIPASGVFGSQPLSPSYGAHRFSVAPGVDSVTGAPLAGALSHNDYFEPGGSSLRNLALVSIGEGALATPADRSAGDATPKPGKRIVRGVI